MLTKKLNFEQIFTAWHNWPSEQHKLIGFDLERNAPVFADEGDGDTGITIGEQYFEKVTAELSSGDDDYLTGFLAEDYIQVDLRFVKVHQAHQVSESILQGPTTEDGETWHLVIDSAGVENCDYIDDDEYGIARVPVVVIDLETMDTTGNSKIFELGAVFGCLLTDRIAATMHRLINMNDQTERQLSLGTQLFHQELVNKNPIYGATRNSCYPYQLADVLIDLTAWIKRIRKRYPNVQVITNGPEFDVANLQSAYDQLRGEIPWSFRANQSLRTLKWLNDSFCSANSELDEFSKQNHGLDHHGFYDAWKEFKYAGFQYRALRLPHTVDLSEGELECVDVYPASRNDDGEIIDRSENFQLAEEDIRELGRLGMPKLLTELLNTGTYQQSDAVQRLMAPYADRKRVLYRTGTLIQHPKGVWWKF